MHKAIVFLLLFSTLTNGLGQQVDTLLADSLRVVDIIATPDPLPPVYKTDSIQLRSLNLFNASLSDALEVNPIHLRDYGPGQLTSISLRGTSASQTSILWNGVNINSPTLGQADLSMIPIAGSTTAEIRYGNANRRDGFGGIGGSVNLTSEIEEAPSAEITLGAASFNTYSAGTRVNYQLGNKWLLSTAISGAYSENNYSFSDYTQLESPEVEMSNSAFNRLSVEQHAIIKIKDTQQLKFNGLWTQTKRQIPPSIGVQSSLQEQSDNLGVLAVSYIKSQGSRKLEASIGYKYGFLTYQDPNAAIHTDYLNHGVQAKVYGKRNLGAKDVIHANVLLSTDWALSEIFNESRVQARAELGYERKLTSFLSLFTSIQPELLNDSVLGILPTVGLKGELLKGKLSWFGTWSRNVRAPTLNDLYWQPGGNPNLKAERDEAFEVSINWKQHLKEIKTSFTLTGFKAKTTDLLVWIPTDQGFTAPVNQDYSDRIGVEANVSLHRDFGKTNIHLNVSGTFLSTNNGKGQSNIYIPDAEFRVQTGVTHKNQMVTVLYSYTGDRFVDRENSTYLPAYDLVDIKYVYNNINVSKSLNLSVSLEACNLFNKSYMVMAGRPMPRRNYRFTLNIKI